MHINLIQVIFTWRLARVTWPLFCRLKSLVSSMLTCPCIWPLLLLKAKALYVLLQVVRRQVTWLLIFGYFLCVFVWSHLTPVRQVIMDVFAMFVALSGSAEAAYAKFKCFHLKLDSFHLTPCFCRFQGIFTWCLCAAVRCAVLTCPGCLNAALRVVFSVVKLWSLDPSLYIEFAMFHV